MVCRVRVWYGKFLLMINKIYMIDSDMVRLDLLMWGEVGNAPIRKGKLSNGLSRWAWIRTGQTGTDPVRCGQVSFCKLWLLFFYN